LRAFSMFSPSFTGTIIICFAFNYFMLNLMLSGIAPRKAGAKLLLFYKSTKFLHDFY